jgi:hypothetical protein
MDWARILAFVTGMVDQELLAADIVQPSGTRAAMPGLR